jgi:hypothetical protein
MDSTQSVTTKITDYSNVEIFWNIKPCIPYMNRRFGGTHHFHLQGLKSAEQETTYGLHGAIFRKMATFKTTAMRISYLTDYSDKTYCKYTLNLIEIRSRGFGHETFIYMTTSRLFDYC